MATTITQDMRYRLSLIKYADRFGVTKAAVKYKTNGSTSTAGNAATTTPLNPCVTSPEGPATIQTSILHWKSN